VVALPVRLLDLENRVLAVFCDDGLDQERRGAWIERLAERETPAFRD
jgi:hypothetical protein